MKISMLEQREAFGSIVEATLSSFLEELLGAKHSVTWSSSALGAWRASPDDWICNPHVNAIFRTGTSRRTLAPVINEYSRSNGWLKRPIQRRYVRIALGRRWAKALATRYVHTVPTLPGGLDWIILGGNRRLRVLDADRGVCYNIAKVGFGTAWMQSEIEARRLAERHGVDVPRLEEVHATWFSEEYLVGQPINRLADTAHRAKHVRKTLYALHRFYEATTKTVNLTKYRAQLAQSIQSHYKAVKVHSPILATRAVDEVASLLQCIPEDTSIPTVQTHGDLQPANILSMEDRVILIDWEYSERRQADYDHIVLETGSRFPKNLAKRLIAWNHSRGASNRYLPDQAQEALFLLEELELKMQENAAPPIRAPLPSLLLLLDAISEWKKERVEA